VTSSEGWGERRGMVRTLRRAAFNSGHLEPFRDIVTTPLPGGERPIAPDAGAPRWDGTQPRPARFPVSLSRPEHKMNAFLRRLLMHYGIYRRYPLGRLPALRNAWRSAL
jgi:hypothetical protein